MSDGAYLYVVRCSDGSFYTGTTRSFYTGTTRSALEVRIAQHNDGTFAGFTRTRLPVTLVFSQWFDRITDAIENERRVKGWSRAKREALIRGDFVSLHVLAKRKTTHPSRRTQGRAPQDEG